MNIKIDKARDWSLRTQSAVFYGVLASNLRDVSDASIQTACTDGDCIRWSPGFVAGLTDEETRFVLLHEAMHCGLGHFWRLPADEDGNRAGDYAINLTLAKIPGIKMPSGGLMDSRYTGMAEEEILAALKRGQRPPQKPHAGGPEPEGAAGAGDPDAGACGGFTEPAAKGDAGKQMVRDKWESAIMQAEIVSRSMGQGAAPSDMQRAIDAVRATPVSWKNEMADFVASAVSSRSDWSRSSRRMATAPVIHPRRRRDKLGLVLFARDTSGSISREMLAEFNSHIESAIAQSGCSAVIVDADAAITAEHWLEVGDAVPALAKGGGGTDFRPVFARAEALADEGHAVAGVIYLTDLKGTEPEAALFPTLWVCTSRRVAKTGRTVSTQKNK